MGSLKIILLTLAAVLAGLAAAAFWFVNAHGISAREKPLAIETFFARRLRDRAVPRNLDLKNPLDPSPLAIAEGRDHFADHCAVCHANDGSGKTQMGSNMYPPAPDMRQAQTQDLTDAQLLFIIRNGVRFTGMPGWGGEDEENWKLVLFIRHLPQITPKELELMNEVNHLGPNSNEETKHD